MLSAIVLSVLMTGLDDPSFTIRESAEVRVSEYARSSVSHWQDVRVASMTADSPEVRLRLSFAVKSGLPAIVDLLLPPHAPWWPDCDSYLDMVCERERLSWEDAEPRRTTFKAQWQRPMGYDSALPMGVQFWPAFPTYRMAMRRWAAYELSTTGDFERIRLEIAAAVEYDQQIGEGPNGYAAYEGPTGLFHEVWQHHPEILNRTYFNGGRTCPRTGNTRLDLQR